MAEPLIVTIAPAIATRVRSEERFTAALARATALQHPLIASPLEWSRDKDGGLRIAFPAVTRIELVPGEQSPADVAILGAQMARALSVIHGAGLVHGAVATEAVMQTNEHGPRLGRFGLFGALCEGGAGVQSAALGISDPVFVAPEVQLGRMPDERSDIFSLGASLYDLLTGKPPYGGRTTSFVMASVLTDQQGAADKTNDAIAGPVIEALLRAIEHAPDDRWPTADAFAEALALAAVSGERTAVPKQRGWLATMFRSWFPARRSRG